MLHIRWLLSVNVAVHSTPRIQDSNLLAPRIVNTMREYNLKKMIVLQVRPMRPAPRRPTLLHLNIDRDHLTWFKSPARIAA